ncbi:uncharacterized protein [Porites lutea]|uniref:uncharacterized protein n=1 Tax=Porites lutea TaxID=51062 RepID=UPI003CC669F5
MTELNDKSFQLVYVGAENDTEAKQIATVVQQNGVSKRQLDICPSPKTEADWKNRLLQVDLAIMPSGEKEFGMEALVALSAGLPLLVHGESGFGESLKNITWGRSAVVDSDNAKDWASKIKNIRETDRKTRLEQAALLRSSYDEKYSWQNQCRSLIVLMFMLFSDTQILAKDESSLRSKETGLHGISSRRTLGSSSVADQAKKARWDHVSVAS